ncbi:thioesterase family protein [Oceanicoccus sp. KOV_DT_Chl]|uniref:acyl-CoA thioesterase n=1 Tax=Oceanicoccus sp. KOV_DT_Chl TaxID=1904639 RepID=UPI000C7AA736|nr:thioesterase family protein [Oceanicoccus sp. KOV_DT_Chl]
MIMSRVEITLPERFNFSIDLPIYISHINRGDHLGNDALISFLNEARIHYMRAHGVDETREQGYLFVNADLAVIYKSEGRYGESLKIEVAASAFHKYGCDIVYRVSEAKTGREIAIAKTAHILFDSINSKPVLAPPSLREKLEQEPRSKAAEGD